MKLEMKMWTKWNRFESKLKCVSIDDSTDEKVLYPLFDYVLKFRFKIAEILISNGTVPATCKDWNAMFPHLEQKNTPRQVWTIIDDAAEELGLEFDDWLILKAKTNTCIKAINQPHPKLSKEQALSEIEKLRSTVNGSYRSLLKNIVNLFIQNQWE